MARLDGSGAVAGRILVKDRQSTYLAFVIAGGMRYPGNVGPGNKRLFVPVAPELIDGYGNLRKNTLKGLLRRSKGKAGQVGVHRTTKKRDAYKRPVWFGTIFGREGIWERPERTKATAPRQVGVRQVHNLGAPKLLVAAFKEEDYTKLLLDFQGITARAHADFADRLSARITLLMNQAIARDVNKRYSQQRRGSSPPQVPDYLANLMR